MKNAEWNKVSLILVRDEDGTGIEGRWSGNLPEIDERVLVYTDKSKRVYMDIWVEFNYGSGKGLKKTYDPVFYWMSLPEPPKIEK